MASTLFSISEYGHTVRYTAEEMRAMPSETNWAKVDSMTEEELEAAIASDPDEAGMVLDWSRVMPTPPPPPNKAAMTMRIDPDVLAFFKESGRGWQTRINAVLRSYMEHQRG